MNPKEFDKLLDEHFEQGLSEERLEAFERASDEETSLRDEVEAHDTLARLLGGVEAPPAPPDFRAKVMERIRAEAAPAEPRPSFFEQLRGVFVRWQFQAFATACLMSVVVFKVVTTVSLEPERRRPSPTSAAGEPAAPRVSDVAPTQELASARPTPFPKATPQPATTPETPAPPLARANLPAEQTAIEADTGGAGAGEDETGGSPGLEVAIAPATSAPEAGGEASPHLAAPSPPPSTVRKRTGTVVAAAEKTSAETEGAADRASSPALPETPRATRLATVRDREIEEGLQEAIPAIERAPAATPLGRTVISPEPSAGQPGLPSALASASTPAPRATPMPRTTPRARVLAEASSPEARAPQGETSTIRTVARDPAPAPRVTEEAQEQARAATRDVASAAARKSAPEPLSFYATNTARPSVPSPVPKKTRVAKKFSVAQAEPAPLSSPGNLALERGAGIAPPAPAPRRPGAERTAAERQVALATPAFAPRSPTRTGERFSQTLQQEDRRSGSGRRERYDVAGPSESKRPSGTSQGATRVQGEIGAERPETPQPERDTPRDNRLASRREEYLESPEPRVPGTQTGRRAGYAPPARAARPGRTPARTESSERATRDERAVASALAPSRPEPKPRSTRTERPDRGQASRSIAEASERSDRARVLGGVRESRPSQAAIRANQQVTRTPQGRPTPVRTAIVAREPVSLTPMAVVDIYPAQASASPSGRGRGLGFLIPGRGKDEKEKKVRQSLRDRQPRSAKQEPTPTPAPALKVAEIESRLRRLGIETRRVNAPRGPARSGRRSAPAPAVVLRCSVRGRNLDWVLRNLRAFKDVRATGYEAARPLSAPTKVSGTPGGRGADPRKATPAGAQPFVFTVNLHEGAR